MQRRLDLPALPFPAKRHQLERFLARPTRVFFVCVNDGTHLVHSSIVSLPPSLPHIKSPLSPHHQYTFSPLALHFQAKKLHVGTQVLKNLTACISLRVYQNSSSNASFQRPIRILLLGECFQSLEAQMASELQVSEPQSTS